MTGVKPRRQRALILLLLVLLPISFIGALYFGGVYIIENLIIAAIVYKLFWKRDWSRKKKLLVMAIPLILWFSLHLYIYQQQRSLIQSANRAANTLQQSQNSQSQCEAAAVEQYDADWLVNCEAHWGVKYKSMKEAESCELPTSTSSVIEEKLQKALSSCAK